MSKDKLHYRDHPSNAVYLTIKQALCQCFAKEKIGRGAFVFGSFANNKYNADSDIDLFVVGKTSNFELNKKIKPIEKKIGREINQVVWPLEDLKSKSKSSFIKDIKNKNVLMKID